MSKLSLLRPAQVTPNAPCYPTLQGLKPSQYTGVIDPPVATGVDLY